MDYLTIIAPSGEQNRFDIESANLLIGRSSSSDLVLPDLNVSRLHAQLVKRAEGFYILDSGGKNGTFVNDRRIAEATRHPGQSGEFTLTGHSIARMAQSRAQGLHGAPEFLHPGIPGNHP